MYNWLKHFSIVDSCSINSKNACNYILIVDLMNHYVLDMFGLKMKSVFNEAGTFKAHRHARNRKNQPECDYDSDDDFY